MRVYPLSTSVDKGYWTKPLRGNRMFKSHLLTDPVALSVFSVHLGLFAKMTALHVQRFHLVKEPIYDTASSTHARGHANPQFLQEHPTELPDAGLALRASLPS